MTRIVFAEQKKFHNFRISLSFYFSFSLPDAYGELVGVPSEKDREMELGLKRGDEGLEIEIALEVLRAEIGCTLISPMHFHFT